MSVEAAIRFAWAVCVPDSPDEKVCSFDVFCALARKLFLVTRLRANGVVDPHACMETVRKDWERFSALKPHLLVSDFERYWLQGVLNAEYGPKDDEAQWIVAMVHRIVEPRLRAKDPERLTVWLWREDADIFSAAMPARGAQRFHVANVKELQDYFERKVSAADPVLAPPPPPPPPPPNEALAALLAEASAPLAESSGVPPGAGAADQVHCRPPPSLRPRASASRALAAVPSSLVHAALASPRSSTCSTATTPATSTASRSRRRSGRSGSVEGRSNPAAADERRP